MYEFEIVSAVCAIPPLTAMALGEDDLIMITLAAIFCTPIACAFIHDVVAPTFYYVTESEDLLAHFLRARLTWMLVIGGWLVLFVLKKLKLAAIVPNARIWLRDMSKIVPRVKALRTGTGTSNPVMSTEMSPETSQLDRQSEDQSPSEEPFRLIPVNSPYPTCINAQLLEVRIEHGGSKRRRDPPDRYFL